MKDLLTGEEFEPKKNSQKFANAANRIKYNNKLANELRKSKAFIDKPLNKNLKILNELLSGKKEAIFHEQYLLGKGFDYRFTNRVDIYEGIRYNCVYQYFIIHNKPNTKIIRDDRY